MAYVFVRSPEDTLMVVDTTQDANGDRSWSRFRCSSITAEYGHLGPDVNCGKIGVGKPSWLKPVEPRD